MKLNISAVTEGWGPGQTGGIEIDQHCGRGGVKRRWMGSRFCEVMTGWGPRSGRGRLGVQAPGGGGGGLVLKNWYMQLFGSSLGKVVEGVRWLKG